MYRDAMDRRNDHAPARNSGQPSGLPASAPAGDRPSLTTPLAWAGGSLLLTGTTFLVSVIALFRAFGSLFH